MENGWTAVILLSTKYPVAAFPLIHCSFVFLLSGESMLELSTNLACWPFEQHFLGLFPPLGDAEWLNCNPRCFDSNNNLPEFRYPIAWPQLMDGWTTGAVLSFDIPLQLSLAAEGFASQWMLFIRLAQMHWHQVKQEILWKSNEWRLLWLHFVVEWTKKFLTEEKVQKLFCLVIFLNYIHFVNFISQF